MFLMLRTGYYLFRFISVFKSVLRIIGGQWYQLGKKKRGKAWGRKRGMYITDNYNIQNLRLTLWGWQTKSVFKYMLEMLLNLALWDVKYVYLTLNKAMYWKRCSQLHTRQKRENFKSII